MTLDTFEAYERYVYALPQNYSSIQTSTLVFARYGKSVAVVRGEVHFGHRLRLVVREQLFALTTVEITDYGYEVWRGNEKLYWYDPQPHPNDPSLSSTDPHHKHVPPDIKHHRIPAPGLSFQQPNLPFLIEEIERDLQIARDEADLARVNGVLAEFERQYGITSDDFSRRFLAGEIADTGDFMEWDAFCKMKQRLLERLTILHKD